MSSQVLIVGAGPTGLVLAISLARHGVPFRIIDANSGPGEQSRAMGVHARTLEFYRQFGFAEQVVAEGIASDTVHLRQRDRKGRSRELLSFTFAEFGEGLSPYPFVLTYAQDVHERLLLRELDRLGVHVEWNASLESFAEGGADIGATILHQGGDPQEARFAFLCGCDGARSKVRSVLNIGFGGGTYEQPFYVADVKLVEHVDTDLYMNLGARILALMMPVRTSGTHRLIGLVPPELANKADLSFEDIRRDVEELVGIHVGEVNWFSRYRVHHRVADHFRIGRSFLLGDAGHIHSPVGGQGMNTGIGDAVNLGWKLASVMRGDADTALLDSYEPERIRFARTLVATTDGVFAPMIASGAQGEIIRRVVAPLAGIAVAHLKAVRELAFETVSQIKVEYEGSPLSQGKAGKVAGGDRLPWVVLAEDRDNFAPLQTLDWQVHVYGRPESLFLKAAESQGLTVHGFEWTSSAGRAGLKQNAAYLIRPDGYVGLALPQQDGEALASYCRRIGLRRASVVTTEG